MSFTLKSILIYSVQEVTLADLFHVPYLSLFGPAKIDVFTNDEKAKKWPNVVRWVVHFHF